MDHGMAPYRVTGDMNMPGALLLEWLVMHGLGAGSLAWRCFDFILLALITAAMAVVAGRGSRRAGIAAGCLFAVIHGVDGLNDAGERDLSIAALILLSYAFLFSLLRSPGLSQLRIWKVFALAFCASAAALIKPTILPLSLTLLTVAGVLLLLPAPRRGTARMAAAALAGLALPFASVLAFLLRQHALLAFLRGLSTYTPYYASLGHRSLPYLLLHSSAPLLPILLCWAAGPAWLRPWSFERKLLLMGSGLALLSYLLQLKGFPYYRYPLLALLLPLVMADCALALRAFHRQRRFAGLAAAAACAALLYSAALAPLLARKAFRFRWTISSSSHP